MMCRVGVFVKNVAVFCMALLLLFLPAGESRLFAGEAPVSAENLSNIEARLDAIETELRTFLDCCRQKEEVVPDDDYDHMLQLCGEVSAMNLSAVSIPDALRKKWLSLCLDEVEIHTFQAIDGYLGDLIRIQTARALLDDCENAMKVLLFWENDRCLTGRVLYFRASILMLEAYRLSSLPRFEEILPLLERACTLLEDSPKDEILAMHALGRAYADLAFADDTSEDRYRELTEKAESIFRNALRLSSGQNGFMRTLLMSQLGNTLNNMDRASEALEILKEALSRVDPSDEPNRFLALHLDIAQVLTGVYLETLSEDDLKPAEKAVDLALLISNSLRPARVVPHIRFNLAMTLFMIAQEKHDPERNSQAVLEIEKALAIWTFDRFINLHLMATDTLCRFLDLQESLTREVRHVDRAIALILADTSRLEEDADLSRTHGRVLGNLYERLSELYFKRALHETGRKQQETWSLSQDAEKRARELQSAYSQ